MLDSAGVIVTDIASNHTSKGIGLIERVKQGQGKPDRVFVKRITVQENTEARQLCGLV